MHLRTVIADTMSAALAKVRRELGEDAVIVAVETTPQGNVEVRAAVERLPQPGGHAQGAPHASAPRRDDPLDGEAPFIARASDWEGEPGDGPHVPDGWTRASLADLARKTFQRTAAAAGLDEDDVRRSFLNPPSHEAGGPLSVDAAALRGEAQDRGPDPQPVPQTRQGLGSHHQPAAPPLAEPSPSAEPRRALAPAAPPRPVDDLVPHGAAAGAPLAPIAARRRVVAALSHHAVPGALTQALAGETSGAGAAADLARALEARFVFDPLHPAPERPVLLAGPPGAGKTATTAKLAARAALSGHSVDVVAVEAARAGADAPLRAAAEAVGAGFIAADDLHALDAWARDRDPHRAAFLDAPSTNPFDLDALEDLGRLARAADAELVVVLDAGAQPMDMAEAATLLRSAGARRFVAAKADVARRIGGVLAAADAGLALAAIAASPFVGGGVTPASALRLARMLLDGVDEEEPADPSPADHRDLWDTRRVG